MIRRKNWPVVPLMAAVGACALVASSCGSDSNPVTAPPAVSPVPTPPPAPPPPTGGPMASSCPLGEGTLATSCDRTSTSMIQYIESAIDAVVVERPELFDLNNEAGPETRQYRVLDRDGYIDSVVDKLRQMGLCAQRNEQVYEQVQIKEDNGLSEDFDIYLGEGFIRRGTGSYRLSCTPASFPIARGPNDPPSSSGCNRPFPPPISRVKVKVHFKGGAFWTLNGTPLVGHDVLYCKEIGFTDGRTLCPVRPEGHPERIACERWAVGEALDTGRLGPTWYFEDHFCTGEESGCQNNPDNQYLLWVWPSGNYKACASNGACGSVNVDRINY